MERGKKIFDLKQIGMEYQVSQGKGGEIHIPILKGKSKERTLAGVTLIKLENAKSGAAVNAGHSALQSPAFPGTVKGKRTVDYNQFHVPVVLQLAKTIQEDHRSPN